MSTHSVNVVEIGEVFPHNNADALETTIVGGWQCVVQKGKFKPGDKAIFVEPDYVVPTTRPEFSFLDRKSTGKPYRLKAVRLRGEISFGLLIDLPAELVAAPVGANVMDELGVTRYEPPVKSARGFARTAGIGPTIITQKFDLENLNKFSEVFQPNEYVYATEKLHGANARFIFWDDKEWIGSRTQWSIEREDGQKKSWWWDAYDKTPGIRDYIKANPGHIVYGEVYGDVQELKYGCKPGEVKFACFAILDAYTGKWFDYNDVRARCVGNGIPLAPLVYEGPYHETLIKSLAEQDSFEAASTGNAHLMEGLVLIPLNERMHHKLGRAALKYISQRYWLA